MEMVIGFDFDFEADARIFALLQSLYMNVDIFFCPTEMQEE